ncbi:hypothetical protein DFH08DRAFT_307595 [Mycena albidolilacea]|uniref:Uncharacterized protein n=1 Tax=Mycena albidolilacea TaxID=1033008 RepID=A0AAD6ZPA7_9AGAR|nr:hypothetical protein DFH08DRAFT_307595 [Mycena albidolilacea]
MITVPSSSSASPISLARVRKKWRTARFGNTETPATYKDAGQHSKVLVGFCMLPNGKMADTQMWRIPLGPDHSQVRNSTLPPNFDLHRYITHVNRGVTHFHASFWALPRDISDSDLESADPPPEYDSYLFDHHLAISGLIGQGVIGIMDEHRIEHRSSKLASPDTSAFALQVKRTPREPLQTGSCWWIPAGLSRCSRKI